MTQITLKITDCFHQLFNGLAIDELHQCMMHSIVGASAQCRQQFVKAVEINQCFNESDYFFAEVFGVVAEPTQELFMKDGVTAAA